jgi:hypothetical protein
VRREVLLDERVKQLGHCNARLHRLMALLQQPRIRPVAVNLTVHHRGVAVQKVAFERKYF